MCDIRWKEVLRSSLKKHIKQGLKEKRFKDERAWNKNTGHHDCDTNSASIIMLPL